MEREAVPSEGRVTGQTLPEAARMVLFEVGQGARCLIQNDLQIRVAYLESHGRRWAIEVSVVQGLVSRGYLRPRNRNRGEQQIFTLTAKGRAAYRSMTVGSKQRWLPWTPLQRLQLVLLPVCYLLGQATTVVLTEVGVTSSWMLGSSAALAMSLPLVLAYLWARWRGW